MFTYLLKDIGWLWLILLYPIAFLIVWKSAKSLRTVWRDPSKEARFASMPKGIVCKPNNCHRYFTAILLGLGCLFWVALVTPIWAVAHNESVHSIVDGKNSNPILVALEMPLGASALIAVYVGLPALLYGYGAAWYLATREGRTKTSVTNA